MALCGCPRPGGDRIRADVARELGGPPSVEALRARSVLDHAATIKAAVLVLAGARDDRTDPAQARTLVAPLRSAGTPAEAIVYPQLGHAIPYGVCAADVDTFLARYLPPGAR